jgi:hypothetical protein
MLSPRRQTLSHELGASSRLSRRAALVGFVKLIAAGWMISGPLGGLAGCASTVALQPTPTPARLRRITPDNASAMTHIATLEPQDRLLRGAAISSDGGIIALGGTTYVGCVPR